MSKKDLRLRRFCPTLLATTSTVNGPLRLGHSAWDRITQAYACSRALALRLQHTSEATGRFLTACGSVGLGRGLGICIPNDCPGDAGPAGSENHALKTAALRQTYSLMHFKCLLKCIFRSEIHLRILDNTCDRPCYHFPEKLLYKCWGKNCKHLIIMSGFIRLAEIHPWTSRLKEPLIQSSNQNL